MARRYPEEPITNVDFKDIQAARLHNVSVRTMRSRLGSALRQDRPGGRVLGHLSEEQLDRLLQNLVLLPELDQYGISTVLNRLVTSRPAALIRFLVKRIGRASERKTVGDWKYHVLPRHQNQIYLNGLKDSAELPTFLTTLLRQIEADESIRAELVDLFWQTTVFDEQSFSLFRPWLHSGADSKFDLAVHVVSHAPARFVCSHQAQLLEILNAAEKLGKDRLEKTIARLAGNIHPSFFVGPASEEPAEIVNARSTAEAALADSELHPLLKRLYSAIKASTTVAFEPFFAREDEEEF